MATAAIAECQLRAILNSSTTPFGPVHGVIWVRTLQPADGRGLPVAERDVHIDEVQPQDGPSASLTTAEVTGTFVVSTL
jgi:hypothetical protein